MDDVFEAELRRRAPVRDLIHILRMALDIHVPRIPIAILRLALWTPVRPDAELRIPKPVGRLILLERVPRRLELPRRNGLRRRVHNHLRNECLGNRVARMTTLGDTADSEQGYN